MGQNPEPQEWFTVAEAGQYLRISVAQVYRLTKMGELPAYHIRQSRRYRRRDLDCLAQPQYQLHQAAEEGDVERVKTLLEGGADVNSLDRGQTPLQVAACFGKTEVAEVLLQHGADVNAKGGVGRVCLGTALVTARLRQYDELAELLRKHGAVE